MGKPVKGDPTIDAGVTELHQHIRKVFYPGGSLSKKVVGNLSEEILADGRLMFSELHGLYNHFLYVRSKQALGGVQSSVHQKIDEKPIS